MIILSYAIAGVVVASFGAISVNYGVGMGIRKILTLLAATVMIFLGFYLTGWWTTGILKIEQAGGFFWRRVEPLAKKLIPIRSVGQALLAGLIWGWLPCGLVYSALFFAMSSDNIPQGFLIMVCFGIGTLPTLLGIGCFSGTLISLQQKQWVRIVSGLIVLCFGIFQFWMLYFS